MIHTKGVLFYWNYKKVILGNYLGKDKKKYYPWLNNLITNFENQHFLIKSITSKKDTIIIVYYFLHYIYKYLFHFPIRKYFLSNVYNRLFFTP